jgi:hypothetical protein
MARHKDLFPYWFPVSFRTVQTETATGVGFGHDGREDPMALTATRPSSGHGGWSAPYGDEVLAAHAGRGIGQASAYLFGRKTYEHMAAH